ncbi:MAG: biopolymer transporter ExbD [Nitrospirota bacterium]|nr:biopolymer transporter ExbD [Nitrospirota bacterium]
MRVPRQLRRMEGRTRARGPVQGLNIVALLDIFTILLLFLLVQAGDPEDSLPVLEHLKLPFSESTHPPRRDLVVAIDSRGAILLEGHQVADAQQVRETTGDIIPGLSDALHDYLAKAAAISRETGQKIQGRVVVMGDRETPFAVLKRVMSTCAAAQFGEVSLAVQQREESVALGQ